MIVFVPGYDAATNANLAVARELVSAQDLGLLGGEATRANLVEALRTRAAEALFSMSHGRPDHLCAQGGDAALTARDAAGTGARSVYAFACHTASRLGAEMSRSGVTWWGYTGAIQCPEDAAPFLVLFVELFRFIGEALVAASTVAQRRAALEEIARRCEDAQGVVDEHAFRDPELDVWAAYHCLLHVWDRLRVWAPGAMEPEAHGRARPPSLFLAE
ncbi:MAG: hypothetical protein ACMG6S_03020 [Byssovorax sp.]